MLTTLARVVEVVCQVSGVTERELTGFRRADRIVEARRAAAYIARQRTTASFTEIGAAMRGSATRHSSAIAMNREAIRLLASGDRGLTGIVEDATDALNEADRERERERQRIKRNKRQRKRRRTRKG